MLNTSKSRTSMKSQKQRGRRQAKEKDAAERAQKSPRPTPNRPQWRKEKPKIQQRSLSRDAQFHLKAETYKQITFSRCFTVDQLHQAHKLDGQVQICLEVFLNCGYNQQKQIFSFIMKQQKKRKEELEQQKDLKRLRRQAKLRVKALFDRHFRERNQTPRFGSTESREEDKKE